MMKKNLVKSEKMESINQNAMNMHQKLDIISEDLKQIKKYLFLHSFGSEKVVKYPLNFYIAKDRMTRFKKGLLLLSNRHKLILPIDNIDDIREICLSGKHGGTTELFRLIFNNIDSKFINVFVFKCDLAEICGFDINDKKSNNSFRNAFNHAKYELSKLKRHDIKAK